MNMNIDLSRELILHRHHNGVQLRRPKRYETEPHLGDILDKRISVFFKNSDHVLMNVNQHQMECINASSYKDIVGKKFIELINDIPLNYLIEENNKRVISSQKTLFFSENITIEDLKTKAISVKMPWYDESDNILGIFGFAHVTDAPCAPSNGEQFADTVNTFFDKNQTVPRQVKVKDGQSHPYSQREVDLIHFILLGKTLHECASLMNISNRTAEHYFANIKSKAGVKTRSALIEVLLQQGFLIK